MLLLLCLSQSGPQSGSDVDVLCRWYAPECVESATFDARSDMYMFGVLCWELLTGCQHVPYAHDDNINSVLLNIATGEDRLQLPDHVSASMAADVHADAYDVMSYHM